MREHYGRGPIKAKTYVLDNLIVCVLSDGFTAIERTMVEGGEPNRVLDMRRDFQRMMKERYSEMIEELTARKVLAFLSQAHIEPDLTIEMFLMDGPVPGFGALELVDLQRPRTEPSRPVAVALNRRLVHERIVAGIIGRDEPEALAVTEPFHGSCCRPPPAGSRDHWTASARPDFARRVTCQE